MRLVVELICCGVLLIVVGCQPKDVEVEKESDSGEAKTVQVSNSALTSLTPANQESTKHAANLISVDKWEKSSAKQRTEIATQLVAQKRLIGLSENDVEKALGNPSRRFERILYSFYVDVSAVSGVTPGLMILIDRAGIVERVGSTGFPEDQNASILPFDKKKWQDSDDYTRFRMAPSVWRGNLLNGKNRTQVLEMLGEPSKTIPPLLLYKCGLPTTNASGEDQPREKTLSLWFENDRVVRSSLK